MSDMTMVSNVQAAPIPMSELLPWAIRIPSATGVRSTSSCNCSLPLLLPSRCGAYSGYARVSAPGTRHYRQH